MDAWEHIFRDPRRAHAIKLRIAQAPWSVIESLFRVDDPAFGAHPWAWAHLDPKGLRWSPPGPAEPPLGDVAWTSKMPHWPAARLAPGARFEAHAGTAWDVPLHLARVWVPATPGAWSGKAPLGQSFLLVISAARRAATLWRATPLGTPVAGAKVRARLLAAVQAALGDWGSESFDVRFETAPRAVDEMLLHERAGTSEAPVTEAALPVLGALAWAASHSVTKFPGGAAFAMLHNPAKFARLLGAVDRVDTALAGGGGGGGTAVRLLPSLDEEHAPRAPAPAEPRGVHHAHARIGHSVQALLDSWPDRDLAVHIEAHVRANEPLAAATLVARQLNHTPRPNPRHAPLVELERLLRAAAEPWAPTGAPGAAETSESVP